jgi:hypothetical protein
LGHFLFQNFAIFLDVEEYLLADFGVPVGASSAEIIKTDIKPFIDIFMDRVVKITDLFRCFILLESLHLGCRSVLIGSTYIEGIISLKSFKSGKDISGKDTTNDIPQMWNIVDVG